MTAKLLLWDIDGTLIDSGGAGEHGLVAGLAEAFGIQGNLDWLSYFGRTDRWIFRAILSHYGIEPNAENLAKYRAAYLKGLAETVDNPRARVLPGVEPLLTALRQRQDVWQGLLTGNMEPGADLKLSHLKIRHYFAFGAFADDSENRNELGPFALQRASTHAGKPISARETVIIGDTPHDIECGKVIGARTLAVATGRYTEAQLAPHAPDILLPNFQDLDGTLQALGLR